MKTLKLESNFSTYQKLQLFLGAIFSLFIILFFLLSELFILGYIVLVGFTIFFIFLIILIFQKIGFLAVNDQLYFAYFISSKVIYKYKVDLKSKTSFSISKTRKSQKFAFASKGNPDMATQFSDFTFYLLNERHTKKELLISIVKEENVEKIINF